MIGTFCLHYKLPLLHGDRDFDPMVKFLGLKTIDTEWRFIPVSLHIGTVAFNRR
jgi:hypothetical protein